MDLCRYVSPATLLVALSMGGCSSAPAGVGDATNRKGPSEPSAAGADCSPGQDQTCNDNPMISSLHGRCRPDGLCECRPEFLKNPETGRCM